MNSDSKSQIPLVVDVSFERIILRLDQLIWIKHIISGAMQKGTNTSANYENLTNQCSGENFFRLLLLCGCCVRILNIFLFLEKQKFCFIFICISTTFSDFFARKLFAWNFLNFYSFIVFFIILYKKNVRMKPTQF